MLLIAPVRRFQEKTNHAIIAEIDKKSGEHDGVSILGGEPFDQAENLKKLVAKLKAKNYHLTIYSGYTLEDLLARKSESVNWILADTDLLIDSAFKRELVKTPVSIAAQAIKGWFFNRFREKNATRTDYLISGKRR